MSQLTNFLKLFKWNTSDEADLEEEFNVDKSMNGNWDKLDTAIENLNNNKVDKVEGKGLSTNDFTNKDKDKLDSLENYDDTLIKQDIADIQGKNTSQDELIAKLKGNMINLTAEGTSINVQDSSDLPSVLEVSGGESQEISLYNGILELGSIQDGVDITANNRIRTKDFIEVKENTNIKISGDYIEQYIVFFYNSDKQFMTYSNWYELDSEISITQISKYIRVVLRKKDDSNLTVNNITSFNIGETPSIDYPSEVEVVGDNLNEFSFENAEKINSYSITYSEIINDNGIKLTSSTDWAYIQYKYTLKANTEYTISYDLEFEGVNNIKRWWIAIEDTEGQIYSNYITLSDNRLIKAFATRTSTDIKISFYASIYDSTQIKPTSTTISNIKIEQGKVATSYSPYGMGSVDINKVNKNLFDKNKANIIYGVVDVTSITLHSVAKTFYIKCNSNTTYTVSREIIGSRFVVGTTSKIPTVNEPVLDRVVNNSGSSITLTTSPNANYLCVYYLFNDTENEQEILNSIQIELGEVATDYIPYESEVYNLSIQQPMLSGDTFVKEDGNWFEVHGWEKYVFTGEEEISVNSIYPNTFNINLSNLNILPNSLSYSNIAIGTIYKPEILNNTDNIIMTGEETNPNRVIHRSSSFSELEGYKQYLKNQYNSGTPAYIWYKLAIPTKLPCTPEQVEVLEQLYNMPTYRPTTNIFTMQDLANLKLSYVADSKIYVDNRINELTNQVNTIIELLSSTETSSILLSNLQKDLESEVM